MLGGYVKRRLDFSFRLGDGTTFDTQNNTAKAVGLRAEVTITKAGAGSMPTVSARVYGLDPKVYGAYTTLGTIYGGSKQNTLTIEAGDDSGMATVFIGTIKSAWTDFSDPANPCLEMEANTGLLEATRPLPPSSFPGPVDVATVIAGIAAQMGWQFENSGVSVILRSGIGGGPNYPGTGREQIQRAAADANINVWMDADPNAGTTVAIWPKGGTRDNLAPLISAETGMVGYPAWEQNALRVTTLFNPSIAAAGFGPGTLMIGGKVQIKSTVPNATGIWQVVSVEQELSSNGPGGPWFTTFRCVNTNWPNSGDNLVAQ